MKFDDSKLHKLFDAIDTDGDREINVQEFVAWLEDARNGLDVFIHPLIEDDYVAHTAMARWLGTPHTLLLDRL